MKDSLIYEMARATAKNWWDSIGDAEQQRMADRYYPDDDFTDTHKSDVRIEEIWSKEYRASIKKDKG